MSPVLVFVVPAVVTAVLAMVTGLAYGRSHRPYLFWWTAVWVLAVVYYLAFIASTAAASAQSDVFANIGAVMLLLGWVRVVAIWGGARLLADRPVGWRTWAVVGVMSLVWLALVGGPLAGQPFAPALTRLSYASWFLLAAGELLLHRGQMAVGLFCGVVLLVLGIHGVIASQLVLDLTGSMMSNWILTALFLALGLGVLGRLLEEERELAAAHGRELASANARLAELDQLKSDFVSMVSHELRTPLGLIKGYTGSLLQSDLVPDESTRHEFLTVIDEETDRLSELVSNLLDVSRIEAGALGVDPRPTRVSQRLDDCMARMLIREPQRDLQLDIQESLPSVLADERRIRQVVDNLLTNAARYSPAASAIGVHAYPANGHVQVEIKASGPGLPLERQEHVFDKFVRLDERAGGTGLGLTICRAIVQAHGGRIWVDSRPGHGSTFAFILPTVPVAA